VYGSGSDRLGVGDVLGHDLAHLGEVPPVPETRLRVQGEGQSVFRVQGSGFRVQGSTFSVYGRVWGVRFFFTVQGSGCRVGAGC